MARYSITYGGGTKGITVLNDTDLAVIWKRDSNYYFFREELSSAVLINGNGYDYIVSFEDTPCTEFGFRIETFCNGQWVEDFTGKFSIFNCEFDKDQCTVSIKVQPTDDYDDILRDIDTEYNIFDVSPVFVTRWYATSGPPPQYIDYLNGRLLDDIMDFFVTKYGLTYNTGFFINPDPIAGFDLSDISFHHKSDIKHPSPGYNPAWDVPITFSDLMKTLHNMFDVWWYINNGVLRLEHEKYFLQGLSYISKPPQFWTTLDLTLPRYKLNKVNKYKYLDVDMPHREEWSMMEGTGLEAKGWIEYNNACTTSDVLSRDITNAITDVASVAHYPDKFSDEGFVILQNVPDGSGYKVNGDNNTLYMGVLVRYYWTYNRVLIEGVVNLDIPATTFESSQPLKEQTTLKFQLCCEDFDPLQRVRTSLGYGYVQTAKKRVKDQQMELVLRYE